MTNNRKLSLFISSKMLELHDERVAVQKALDDYDMHGWLWEKDAGARPEPIRSTYLSEVNECDIYIGLFWLGYGKYTIEEYDQARKSGKACLIYEKRVDVEKRDPELTSFLKNLQSVESEAGLTVAWFQTPSELASQIQKDVLHLLVTKFRASRFQPSDLLGSRISSGQRSRLEQELEILKQEWDLRTKKLQRLRKANATETDVSSQFKLESQIKEEEDQTQELKRKIEEIEQKLV